MNNQMRVLLRKTDASKPLYLTIACEELRVHGVYETVSEKIKNFGSTIPKLLDEVLARLEVTHGKIHCSVSHKIPLVLSLNLIFFWLLVVG